MTDRITNLPENNNLSRPGGTGKISGQPSQSAAKTGQVSFEEMLKEKQQNLRTSDAVQKIKFSGHAMERVRERNIVTEENTISKLETAIEKAKNKGARECVVLMDNNAYVVSVKNNTVVTAISKEELKERIFTSIDSVIVV